MTKKLLIIIFLIMIIISQMSFCYADLDNRSYLYNLSNNNLITSSYSLDITDNIRNDLINNHYKSIISRYSTPVCRVSINFSMVFLECTFASTTNDYGDNSWNAFNTYMSNYQHNLNYRNIDNIDDSQLNVFIQRYRYGGMFSAVFRIVGQLSFDLKLNNSLLTNDIDTLRNRMQYGGFEYNILNTYFTYNGYTFYNYAIYDAGVSSADMTISYSFDRVFNNVDGFIFQFSGYVSATNTLLGFDLSDNIQYTFCNSTTNVSPGGFANLFGICLKCDLVDNSQINAISINTHKTSSQSNSSYDFNNNSQTLNFTFAISSPLFYNNNDYYIQSSDNNTDTPLKLQYYDCEWYEIHLQLANAFIFFITEFPLISDITNLIYSLFVVIKQSIDVLLNFDGFGILFGFGMFAIVFGFIYKLIVGD